MAFFNDLTRGIKVTGQTVAQKTKEIGEKMIRDQLKHIPMDKVRKICEERLDKIENGIRDFRF